MLDSITGEKKSKGESGAKQAEKQAWRPQFLPVLSALSRDLALGQLGGVDRDGQVEGAQS